MRYLQVVHAIRGRTRLRFPILRQETACAETIADALAAMRGVHEVRVRPYTGSILVTHEAEVTPDHLVDEIQRHVSCGRVLRAGERLPPRPAPELSRIGKLAAKAFREIDRDVLRISNGTFDLGTLVTLGFLGMGTVEVVTDREMPLPPWSQLAWWAYRTFTTNEQQEIAHAAREADGA
jgi:Heavy metal associated domain 2